MLIIVLISDYNLPSEKTTFPLLMKKIEKFKVLNFLSKALHGAQKWEKFIMVQLPPHPQKSADVK